MLIRHNHDLFDLFHEFDGAFRTYFNEPPVLNATRRMIPAGNQMPQRRDESGEGWFRPAVEAFTKDGNLVVRAELPGVTPENIEVIADGRTLTIRGEKKDERTTGDETTHIREFVSGRFERSFTLPEDVVQNDIKANHVNGVLELTVPLKKAAEPKRIPIQTSDLRAVSSKNAA